MSERNVSPCFYLYFSCIKSATQVTYHSVYLDMAARKRLLTPQPTDASAFPYLGDPKGKAPEIDTCNLLTEAISPYFDPNRVLLQRVFLINEENTTEQYVATMADCLPRICDSMCGNEQYGRSDGPFRLNTTGSYRNARLYKDKHFVALKYKKLHYLQNMIHIVQIQMNLYINA